MFTGNHRSFRLTPEPYLVHMQVKPRLRCVYIATWIMRLSLIFGSIALFWAIVMLVPEFQPESHPFGLVGAIGHLFIALLMDYLGFFLGRAIAMRFGWLSVSEAEHYQYRMYQWPDCWLEPRPGQRQQHPLDATEGEQSHASEHSAHRILKSRNSTRAS